MSLRAVSREPVAGSRRAAPRTRHFCIAAARANEVCKPVSRSQRVQLCGCRLPAAGSRLSSGFTLLEVLLAITLLALLLAGAYGGIRTAVKAMHSGERVIERLDRVRTVQGFLRHQLSRIMPLPYERTPEGAYVFEGDGATMRFVAPMPGYLSHGGPYVQTLALTRGGDGMRLVFSGAMLNGFDPKAEQQAERKPVVLLDHIRDGAFAYRALDQQGDLGPWTQTWDDTALTPLMIQIRLVMQNGARVDWPTLEVPLMLDVGAARIRAMPPAALPRPQGGGVVR